MNTTIDTLTRFNRQVLQCQDEAYTLAFYLLGDSTQAEAVTQAAVIAAYRVYAAQGGNTRRLILKEVARQCVRQPRPGGRRPIPATGAPSNSGCEDARTAALLLHLPEPERLALVLVEVLGLSYPEASAVAGVPVDVLRRNLAEALRKVGVREATAEAGVVVG